MKTQIEVKEEIINHIIDKIGADLTPEQAKELIMLIATTFISN